MDNALSLVCVKGQIGKCIGNVYSCPEMWASAFAKIPKVSFATSEHNNWTKVQRIQQLSIYCIEDAEEEQCIQVNHITYSNIQHS